MEKQHYGHFEAGQLERFINKQNSPFSQRVSSKIRYTQKRLPKKFDSRVQFLIKNNSQCPINQTQIGALENDLSRRRLKTQFYQKQERKSSIYIRKSNIVQNPQFELSNQVYINKQVFEPNKGNVLFQQLFPYSASKCPQCHFSIFHGAFHQHSRDLKKHRPKPEEFLPLKDS